MKVLLLDDHPLVRSALESVLRSLGNEVTVLSVANADLARRCLLEAGPVDLALLDLHLPDGDGFSVMAEWRKVYPNMPVVIISASEDPHDVRRALEEGVQGFIPKRTANEVLVHALKMVMSGGIYVPPTALRMGPATGGAVPLVGLVRAQEPKGGALNAAARSAGSVPLRVHRLEPACAAPASAASACAAPASAATASAASACAAPASAATASAARGQASRVALPGLKLTPRQAEVLYLLLQGQPNKLIARQLNLSVETVKDHVASLLRLLGVSTRTQAVLVVGQLRGTADSPLPRVNSVWAAAAQAATV